MTAHNSCKAASVKKKIALLSNVTVDLLVGKLRRNYDIYIPEGFDTWIQEVLNPAAGLYGFDVDAIVVLLDGTEARSWKNVADCTERIALWKQTLAALTDRFTSIPVFVSTIDIRENRIKSLAERKNEFELENDWYQYVQGLVENKGNVYILDIKDVITEIGRNQFYANKMWYMSSMPYSREGLTSICKEIHRALEAAFISRKKIIVLDLDNTLWGGVIGEDGVEGIELSDHKEGQRFYDFQRQLLEMKNRGILLAVNSKNNLEDAESAIKSHPAMLLRMDDFVSQKVNWDNKAINLKAIEGELNITEGGFIFIDDNPVERETVKGECREVVVPEFPADTTELLGFAEDIWLDYCRPLRVLNADLEKTKQYQDEAKRKKEMNSSLNLDDYIAKLEMVVDIHRMKNSEIERVVQMLGKTNQFNLTTKRYTMADVEEINANPLNAIYVVYVSDKYGDSGLVSVIIAIENGDDVWLDNFLMSCRVMGRKLEEVIINELLTKYTNSRVWGEYIPTDKNAPVKELYNRLGFLLSSDDNGHKIYVMDTVDYHRKHYSSFKKIKFEDKINEN